MYALTCIPFVFFSHEFLQIIWIYISRQERRIICLRTSIYETFIFCNGEYVKISSHYKGKWLLSWTQNQKRKLETIQCTYFKPVCQLLTGETQTLRRFREILLNSQTFVNVDFNDNSNYFFNKTGNYGTWSTMSCS